MRTFIQHHIKQVIELNRKQYEGICQKYLEEKGCVIPDDLKSDPFAIFDLYVSGITYKPPTNKIQELKREIEELNEKVAIKQFEIDNILSAQDVILADTRNMELRIEYLDQDNERLRKELHQ